MARHWTTPAAGAARIDTNATAQQARGVRAASIAVAALTFVPLCWRLASTAYGKACERGSYECSRRLRRYAAMLATVFVLTVVGVPGQLSPQTVEDPDTPPNIVVFVSDDMGWWQPGFNGGTEVETPHMDRLADEGVKLTQFYVQPVCAPTRASLFTGRYAWKTGMAGNPDDRKDDGLLLDERTIAEALRDSSYATWLVGKWHAGHWGSERLPLQRGFDHHYGFYDGFIDSYKLVRPWRGWHEILDWHRNGRPVVESGYSTFLLAEEASQLIERHDGSRPFFLYVAFNAPHDPYQAPPEYIAQFSHLPYDLETRKQRAMVKAMDDAIGQVMDALERRGVLEETLVMFLNDNGGESEAGGNSPYRGLKRSYLEGGIRVPAVMRWPSRITAGSASDAIMHVADLFPTFAGLAGADTGGGLPLDGLDVWEAIANGAESPREEVVHSLDVIRVGDWKLLEEDGEFANGKSSPLQLYNIAEDPYETTNLASSETARVAELRERLVYHRPFARDAEPGAPIPGLDRIDSTDDRLVMFGEEENTAFGTAVQTALTQREAGNLGPALLRLEASGTSLKLIYNETLDAGSVPPADAFTVVVNPGYRAAEVVGVEVSGSEVVLTLAEAVADGNTVGLTYEVPDTGAIQDADSLEAVGITWVTMTVTSVPPPPPPPPLTAEFPASDHTALVHTGSGDAPQVIVAFNQPVVDFSASSPSISVQGGTVESVGPHLVAGEPANAYVVTLTPAGTSDITIGLVADQPCADGGICTAGETLLSEVSASHVIRADTTPPTVSNIEITSDPGTDRTYAVDDEIQVTVTFSETVAATGMPELRLELGGGQRTATYEGGSGTAALVFGYTVAAGESDMDGVGVEADSLSGGTIRDGAGHNAVLDHQALAANASHKVDGVKPALAATDGALVNGTTLTLTYDEALDGGSRPVSGDFTVSGGDRVRAVTGVRVNGSGVELTLDVGAEHGEAGILVSYTVPTGMGANPIRDVPGNDAEALSRESVTNETPDTTSPEVSILAISSNPGSDRTYAAGDEIRVTVTFSETVEVEGTPQLRLRVGSRTRTAGYLEGTGTTALVFGYEIADGDEDTDGVSIEAGRIALNGGTIKDEADNNAVRVHGAVAPQAGHKVDGVRPAFLSAAVDGASLTLTYGEALDGGSRPATGDFTVQVDGAGRSVSGVSVSGSVVILTLDPAVEHGDTGIRVSYTPGTRPIQDTVGNDAVRLSNEQVTNTTGDTTGPTVSRVEITSRPERNATYAAGTEIAVTVTFSETVVVTGTPRLSLNVGGVNRPAAYRSGTGAAAVFVYMVADGESDTDGVSIEANSLTLNGGRIRDGANNNALLTHDGLAANAGHKVDGVKPALAANGGAVVNGTTLTLTFGERLDGSSTPQASAFTVTGGDTSRTVTAVALSGSAVLLTVDPAVEHGETGIRVSYTVPTGTGSIPLQDVLGNDADRLSNVPVTNETPDTTSPTVSKLEITSDPGTDRTYAAGDEIRVTVTFSEPVDVERTPRLMLKVGDRNRPAGYLEGTGTTELVFGYEVADGDEDTDGVSVEAGRLTLNGGTIRDGSNNNAVLDHDGLAANAGHKVDGVKPALAANGGAVVNGTTLTLTYDEALDGGSRPVSGDFTVSGGDRVRAVTGVRVNGSGVELTLDVGAEHGEAGILVSYTVPTGMGANPIRDVPGNDAEALSRESVTNETPDTTSPEVSILAISSNPGFDRTYAAGDEIEVTATFSETVEVEGTPQLRLRVGSRTRTAGYLRGTGTTELVFGYEVADGDEDTDGVSIEAGRIALNGGTIEDEGDNPAELDHEAVAPQAGHKVDGVRPAFLSAAVDGASLTLTYGEALDGRARPATGDFTVQVDGAGRSVSGVSVSGSVVILTLDPAVEHGDTGIRVSYTPGTRPIQDTVGNDAVRLSNESVTNTTGTPNTAPQITSPESFDVRENQAMVRRLAAGDTDPGDEVTGWSIVGGADRFQFSIASDTGVLSFRTAPDYEDPRDTDSSDPVSGAGDNEYVVTVEARSGTGARQLEMEQTIAVRVTDEREPPGVPEAPTFSGETADSLQVSWSEPDNTGPPITDYDVQYREKGTGGFIDAQHAVPGRTAVLADLKVGTVYEAQVRATNDEGMSEWSESGEGRTVTPLIVQMTTGLPPPVEGPFTVRFSFSETVRGFTRSDIETQQEPACTDNANNPVSCNPGFAALQTTDDRIFTTTVTPGTEGVAHNYTLTISVRASGVTSAVDNKPNEAATLEVRIAPPGVTAPISSIGLRGNAGNGQVTLSWNTPADPGGDLIVRYEYRYRAEGEEWSDWENATARARGVTVENLINGREYVFEARAVNALGKGSPETAVATPVVITPPRPPTTGGGGGGGRGRPPSYPGTIRAEGGDGEVTLTWDAPSSQGSSRIQYYEYRIDGGGEWISTGSTDRTHMIIGLINGRTYIFHLRAVSAAGAGSHRISPEVTPVADLDFTHFANGGFITSTLALVNAGAYPVRPAIYFYDQDGDPIAARRVVELTPDLEVGDDGALSPRTVMNPLSELTIATHGRGGLRVGSVTVRAASSIGGVLRFDIPGFGVAGVGDSPTIRDALVPVRRQDGGINTGVAVRNRGTATLTLQCRLMRDGAVLEEADIRLKVNGQDSRFIDQVFPAADTSDFAGSVRCAAPEPGRFSAVAFELDGVNRIFTTLPVVSVPAVLDQEQEQEEEQDATRLDFTHFANGGKIVSSLVLVNAGANPVRPAIYFYDQDGGAIAAESMLDVPADMEIGDDGALRPGTAMNPLGELTISSHGRGVLTVGSVTVTADGPIGGVLRFDIPGLGVAGVGDSPPVRDALLPVRRQNDGINTGVAVHNRGTTALLVRCRLMRDGVVLEETMIPLAANGQDSRFIDQVFPTTDTSDFVGSVRCLTPEPGRFSAVAFELDGIHRIFTTLPVVPVVEVP